MVSDPGASPFARAVETLRRPLLFAAADDFAHADRLRDLEHAVHGAALRAGQLAIPVAARRVLAEVAKRFAAPIDPTQRVEAVRWALAETAPLADRAQVEAWLAESPGTLPGIGPKRARTLAGRGLATVQDLLFQLPLRYDDRRALSTIAELEVGRRGTFVAEVQVADFAGVGRRGRIFQAVVGDGSGTVNLKWFRGGEALHGKLVKGKRLLVTGDVRRYRFSKELIHPEIEILGDEESPQQDRRRVVADYGSPERLPARTLRGAVEAAVAHAADLLEGHLPARLVAKRGLPAIGDALRQVHALDIEDTADPEALRERRTPAYERLVLEELFLLEVGLALRREARRREPGIALDLSHARIEAAPKALPFTLTGAQQRAWQEIRHDLGTPHPMNRLLQGDVGSGKTAVAFLAAIAVAADGRQVALMAPTELLAEQHERTLQRLSEAGGAATALRIARLTASLSRSEADAVRAELAAGSVDLVVGTHSLVQQDVHFRELALAIVDEQHRFGVLQRRALADKTQGGLTPHVLVMTATPIPRTLALTLYGDLDLSVIDELPPGRQPVATDLLRTGEGRRVLQVLRDTLARGEQVYVVYPLVEESEKIDLRAATEQTERIRAALPGVTVDLVHGRLSAPERADAMARFERGEIQVLVSTTVIEVGVDVPNASLMVVEHAERFGLAQLHQLRGRVGRGTAPGTCLLVARGSTEESEARLHAMLDTTDGFAIADADLRIRGPGEFLGTRQHGRLPDLRIANLLSDAHRIPVAREAALETVRRDPQLRRSPHLARAVEERWGERLDLARVG